ncbi:MAG: (d)CMP kinase [Desulfovibrio sp.]|jgi:cytidylate kinase|nr:(d)CMP kinase [Desulfovibrio sp.]
MNSRKLPLITIDGPAGAGKSTLAERVAKTLGIACLDTGAMFRTLAVVLCNQGFDPEKSDPERWDLDAAFAACSFSLGECEGNLRLFCNKAPVGEEIRTEKAGMAAAQIAVNARVRNFLKEEQQKLGKLHPLVAEGRDTGTVIFPDALCKIYLEASAKVRALRRCEQLRRAGVAADPAEIEEKIRERDLQDSGRALAPLRPAADARIIDTTEKNPDEVFAEIMRAVAEARVAAPAAWPMRRKDREISREAALDLLRRAEYGILALDDGSSWPYAVPLSFVLLGENIYFHCATKGRKLDILKINNRACFTAVSDVRAVFANSFSTCYSSAMVFGRVLPVEDREEKNRALDALAWKYLPEHAPQAGGYIEKSFQRTAVCKLVPELINAKARTA